MSMSKPLKLIFLILVAIPLNGVFAQNSKISSEEFNRIKQSAEAYLSKNPFSSVYTSEWRDPKTSKITTSWLIETAEIPPSRMRKKVQLNENGKTTITETIVIDSLKYVSKDNGKWVVSQISEEPNGMSLVPDALSVDCYSYNDPEDKTGKGKIYVMERKSKYRLVAEKFERISKYTTKLWIGSDGQFLKVVSSSEGGPSDDNRSETVYSYPKDLKIEAPIK